MQWLEVGNDRATICVSRDAYLSFRLAPDGDFRASVPLQEGTVAVPGAEPVNPVLSHAMPCVFEQVVVRVEGLTAPVLEQAVGMWPQAVVDDELETYPHLHFLEERKTGTPWRLERWYTLAGPYLVVDSQQYFERPQPAQRGKNWERLIVHLRQVVDLTSWASQPDAHATGLVSASTQ
jgi:hypothetical protein